MRSFGHAVLKILSDSQRLTGAEKMLVNNLIGEFEADYRNATGNEPNSWLGDIYLIAPRLESYGFKMFKVGKWRREDMENIRAYAETMGVELKRKER